MLLTALFSMTQAFTVSSKNAFSVKNTERLVHLSNIITTKKSSTILLATANKEQTTKSTTLLQDKEPESNNISAVSTKGDECAVDADENLSESQKLLKKVKEAGTAGIISYALWELGFWAVSVPVVIFGYYEVVGHMPDFSNKDDMAKLGGEAFAFVNFARFAVPLRIGLALSTTPWIQKNIVDRFMKKDEDCVVDE